jgi:hypothetical protein
MVFGRDGVALPTADLWKYQARRNEIAKEYLDTWNNTALRTKSGRPIDGIIR